MISLALVPLIVAMLVPPSARIDARIHAKNVEHV